jgi:hypothetical protein
MRRFLDHYLTITAAATLFALAIAWNTSHGGQPLLPATLSGAPSVDLVAHGPTMPPDPWDWTQVAHGPTMPPDPWDWSPVSA